MKFYFSPGAAALPAHIALITTGLPYDAIRVDPVTRKTVHGTDFLTINAKGHGPALQLDSGQILTEVAAIVQYIADEAPASQLAPPAGTMERYRLIEWLAWIGTEIHPAIGVLARADLPAETAALARQAIATRVSFLESTLSDRCFLTGTMFSVADAYLFGVLSQSRQRGIDLAQWPSVDAYLSRIAELPAVRTAMVAEGWLEPSA